MGAQGKGRCSAATGWTGAQLLIAGVLASLVLTMLPWSACAAAPVMEAPAGALDPSFASGGVLTASFGTAAGPQEGHDATIQPDGKIIVLTTSAHGDYLSRYLPDGEPDTTFGNAGIVSSSGQSGFSYLAVDSEGRIVVIGGEPAPNWEAPDKSLELQRGRAVIYRFLPDGSLDLSFGGGGKTTISVPPPEGLTPGSASTDPLAVLTASDGSIVVGGNVASICGWEISNGESRWWEESGIFVARLTSNGSLESQFGTSGIVSTHGRCQKESGAIAESFGGLAQPSPEAVLALSNHPEDDTWRFRNYSSTGALLETSTSVESENAVELAMVDGHYIILSENHAQSGLLFSSEALRQFTPKETVDSTFGTNGRVAIPSMGCESGPGCFAVLPDGRILVAGRLYRGLVGVRRYLANGSEDDSFGAGGSAWAELTHEGEMTTVNKLLILHGQPLIVGAEQVLDNGLADNQTALTLFQGDGGFSSSQPPPKLGEGPFSPLPTPPNEGSGSPGPDGNGPSTGAHLGSALIGSGPGGSGGGTIQTGAITGSIGRSLVAVLSPHNSSRMASDLLRSGVYGLNFSAPSAGRLTVQWTTLSAQTGQHRHPSRTTVIVASGAKIFSAAGRGTVTLRLTAAGRNLLKITPVLRVIARASFESHGGRVQTRQSILTLRTGRSTRH